MPEIKNQFTGGKMNQDLDERLIPNGEYREAMNIEVANSEGSDVGTAQNILGNQAKLLTLKAGASGPNFAMGDEAVCVGSISDEKNDTMYYLVWSEEADFIIQWDGSVNKPVFIDSNKSVLKFTNDMVITGINVIDGMLFWTDNINEPRKINIQRCIDGTPTGSNLLQTRLYNSSVHETLAYSDLADMEEKHITVVKKAPQFAPDIKLHTSRELDKVYTVTMKISSSADTDGSESGFVHLSTGLNDFSSIETTEGNNIIFIKLDQLIFDNQLFDNNTASPYIFGQNVLTAIDGWGLPYQSFPGKKVVLQAFDEDGGIPGLPLTDFALKGEIISVGSNAYDLEIKITTIDGFPPQAEDGQTRKYVIDLFDEEEKLFEFKFPRFSYRYKYEDGEYSAFAPFTQVAFTPGAFDYHPRKGYNIGMTNKLSKVEILNIVTKETPKDVAAVDILFKDDSSPSIYVVDTIKPDDYSSGTNLWDSMILSHSDPTYTPQASFVIEKEAISSIVPSNQLLRPWDNVPRKALAQDVSGNRIIYANYVQNYDLLTSDGNKYAPGFTVTTNEDVLSSQNILEPTTNLSSGTFKSIKSLREYQLGVVFLDEYGRETPVISNASGSTRINKVDADNANRFGVQFSSDEYPQSLTHFKFFVKETSSEYYNMAMDRWYSAGDGNVWLAFPSSDRNKIDIDTFLILKKGSDQDTLVQEAARYKVLAIENEAPDFVKTTKRLVVTKQQNALFDGSRIFDGGSLPLEGVSDFQMQYQAFHGTSGQDIASTNDEVYIEFGKIGTDLVSNRYKINSITNSWNRVDAPASTDILSLELDEKLGDDVNFITNGQIINNGVLVKIYKYKVENLEKFDGRFFVKIYFDEVFRNNIEVTTTGGSYRQVAKQQIYSLDKNMIAKHTSDLGNFITRGYGHTRAQASENWLPAHYQGTYNSGNIVARFETHFARHQAMFQYGYYSIAEFAASALYFRRYREKRYDNRGGNIDYGVTGITGQGNPHEPLNQYGQRNVRALVHLVPGGSATGQNRDHNLSVVGNMGEARGKGQIPYKARYVSGGTEYWKDAPNWWKEFGYATTKDAHRYRNEGMIRDGKTRGVTSMWAGFVQGADTTRRHWYHEQNTEDYFQSDNVSVRETEVWFIDKGEISGLTTTPNLNFDSANASRTAPTGDGYGIRPFSNQFQMLIGFGGIKVNYGPSAPPYSNVPADFWNVGDWNQQGGGNTQYNDNQTKRFVNGMKPGGRFRFTEDPTGQVYTILGNVVTAGALRHSDGPILKNAAGALNVPNGSKSTYLTEYQGSHSGRDLRSMAEVLSFNMSKRWNMDGIEPSILGKWNPMFDGIIPGGINVKLQCVGSDGSTSGNTPTATGSNASGQTAEDLEIFILSLSGVDQQSNADVKLHEGMALTSFVNTIDGAVDLTNDIDTRYLVVREITKENNGTNDYFKLKLGGWASPLKQNDHDKLIPANNLLPKLGENTFTFQQVGMNGYSPNSEFNINTMSRYSVKTGTTGEYFAGGGNNLGAIASVGYGMEFIEEIEPIEILSENPAIFETEPKDLTELDIYYEASGSIPAKITKDTIASALPIGTKFLIASDSYTVVDYEDDKLIVYGLNAPSSQIDVKFFRPDDLVITTDITGVSGNGPTFELTLEPNLIDNKFILPWHNCYTFKNGVESNRIRDNFNLPFISNGVKASTTLEQEYKEERRKYGLIYSGIYNSTSGINNLNQFIAGEKITKDVNPIYGSIQKLYSRNSDLVTLCEDKILRIQANKDALFNADGNSNVIATDRVLGQTIPFTGEYGISKNPESFASESYRAYFTDKVRGAVVRMSMDGLTPISSAGMKDYFRDNLKTAKRLLGSYDDRNGEYNLALNFENRTQFLSATADVPEHYEGNENNKVLTFSEKVGGWVSFKSFTDMQGAISLANEYYTFKDGVLYLHYSNDNRNTFYGVFTPSTIDVVLNQDPGSVKEFTTLNYEGSQSNVNKFKEENLILPEQPNTTYNDQEYYNLSSKKGWYVQSIITNKEEGYINEFLEKEGKWFNGINKKVDIEGIADTADFTFQGIGEVYDDQSLNQKQHGYNGTILSFELNSLNVSLQVGDLVYVRETMQQLGPGSYGSEGIVEDKVSLGDLQGTASLVGTLRKIEDSGNYINLYIEYIQGSFSNPSTEGGVFAMFSKHNQSMGHVLGYYAKIRLENNSTKKAEIFSIGSEIIINSK